MAHEIRVPRLGWSMEEGTFVRWLKQDGDQVRAGEALFELEGEKALQEIESLDAGLLRIPPDAPPAGSVVPVGALLAYLVADGESSPWEQRSAMAHATAALAPLSTVTVADEPPPAGRGPKTSSPRARRVAAELDVDWQLLQGSGRGGRVRESDVRAAAIAAHATSPLTVDAEAAPLSPRRRIIAERMRTSQRQNSPVTLTTRADATNLVSLRSQFKSRGNAAPIPAFTDIVACLVAGQLKTHRHMAGRWDEMQEQIILPDNAGLHIGIAVDTEQGLLVPVIRNVGGLTLLQVAERSRTLVELARQGRLHARDLQDGIFTITNLGSFGVDAFTPIINYPEAAILGLGAIRREMIVLDDDRYAPRDLVTLSLTFDHCRIDGAPAARFLQDLRIAIENPSAWLL
jgi:pyruvate dehydrogenase E2 component (dihydrolipoamide acetyltransferase)